MVKFKQSNWWTHLTYSIDKLGVVWYNSVMINYELDSLTRNIGAEVAERVKGICPSTQAHYGLGSRMGGGGGIKVQGQLQARYEEAVRAAGYPYAERNQVRDEFVYVNKGEKYTIWPSGTDFTHGIDDGWVHQLPEVPGPPEWR